MGRFLVRSRRGDKVSADTATIKQWLEAGECGPGDYTFVEDSGQWITVAELPGVKELFAQKPKTKHERPLITIYSFRAGKEVQEGPVTLSRALEMIRDGEVSSTSWIFIEGDKEWRQVKNVKILRQGLPPMPQEVPQLDGASMPPPSAAPEISMPAPLENPVDALGIDEKTAKTGPVPEPAAAMELPKGIPAAPPVPPVEIPPIAGEEDKTPVGIVAPPGLPPEMPAEPAVEMPAIPPTDLPEPAIPAAPTELSMPDIPAAAPMPAAPIPEPAGLPPVEQVEELPVPDPAGISMPEPVAPPMPSPEAAPLPDVPPVAAMDPPAPPAPPVGEINPAMEQEEPSVRLDLSTFTETKTGAAQALDTPMPPAPEPVASAAPPPPAPPIPERSSDFGGNEDENGIPVEEQTKAVSALGLADMESPMPDVHEEGGGSLADTLKPGAFAPIPDVPSKNQKPAPKRTATRAINDPPADKDNSEPDDNDPLISDSQKFQGLVAEIPAEPIWLLKQNTDPRRVVGPYTFKQVRELIDAGRLTPEDKISKVGTNRFNKVSQQYEFNVKYSIETVVEGGVEKEKILVKRRHPRVPYITSAVVIKAGQQHRCTCINISGGGVLVEGQEFPIELGDTVHLELMPGQIDRKIVTDALLIGKINKAPPGFAFRFVQLQREDKEAIEYFVSEAMKREMRAGL